MRTDARVARGLGVALVSLFLIGGVAFAALDRGDRHFMRHLFSLETGVAGNA